METAVASYNYETIAKEIDRLTERQILMGLKFMCHR